MVFIAELFWWFENVKPDFVQPRDIQELKDGEWGLSDHSVFLKAQRIEEAHITIKASVPFLSVLSQTKSPSLPFLSVHVPVCVVFKLGNSLRGSTYGFTC